MTRVALMPSAYPPAVGGVEELTRHLALSLVAAGDEVEVWTLLGDDSAPETVEVLDGLVVRRFPMPLPATERVQGHAHRSRPAGGRCGRSARAVATFRPDVLHVQCFGPNGAYATALARLCHVPLVVTLQGETLMDDSDIFETSQSLRAALRAGLRTAAAVTGCSQFTLDDAVARFGLPAGRGMVIFNGVAPAGAADACAAVDLPYPLGTVPYVLALGRVVDKKGFDLLLAGYAAMDPTVPDGRPGHRRHGPRPRAAGGHGRGVGHRRPGPLRRAAVTRAGGGGHGRCGAVRDAEPARAVRHRRPRGLARRDGRARHRARRDRRSSCGTARTACWSIPFDTVAVAAALGRVLSDDAAAPVHGGRRPCPGRGVRLADHRRGLPAPVPVGARRAPPDCGRRRERGRARRRCASAWTSCPSRRSPTSVDRFGDRYVTRLFTPTTRSRPVGPTDAVACGRARVRGRFAGGPLRGQRSRGQSSSPCRSATRLA